MKRFKYQQNQLKILIAIERKPISKDIAEEIAQDSYPPAYGASGSNPDPADMAEKSK